MSNVIDLLARLKERAIASDAAEVAAIVKEILETGLNFVPFNVLLTGITKHPAVAEISDSNWSTIGLDITGERIDDVVISKISMDTRFRPAYMPEYPIQEHLRFLQIVAVAANKQGGHEKTIGDHRQKALEAVNDYAQGFPQIQSSFYAVMLSFIDNLFNNTPTTLVNVEHSRGQVILHLLCPDVMGQFDMRVTATFDFLPFVLDSSAVAKVNEIPDSE